MPADVPTIRKLPESVALRLRSTLVVTSLSDAVFQLVQNSLDADARSIRVQANLARNSCVVEDDGVGIQPVDMGMVGQMYATSKYPSATTTTFGFRGQALSALATHSLFTLTSRHRVHRSTHTVRISYSTPVFTGLAPEHLRLPATGTVVRIEGLWGDMPVRLKARQHEDVEREWEDVTRALVQLLLTPQGKGVAVIARDENGNRRMVVKDTHLGPWEMGVLRQVYGRDVAEGWERVRAQQGGVRIDGWICTKGSGTRGFQFLYINGHPLPPSTTLLHAEINRVLAASSFGVVVVVEEDEGRSRARNGPRKGVEKWGMFILHIECADGDTHVLGGEGGTEGKAGLGGDHLQAAISLLQKLLKEFLKTHNFSPLSANTLAKDSEPKNSKQPPVVELVHRELPSRPSTPLSTIRNNSSREVSRELTPQGDMRALATWSRIKSAKVDIKEEEGRQQTGFGAKEFTFSFAGPAKGCASDEATATPVREGSVEQGGGDEYVAWTNPVSKKSFQVNSRTGNTITTAKRYSVQPSPGVGMGRSSSVVSIPGPGLADRGENSRAKRLRRSESTDTASKGAFVEQLLKNWKNPVFELTSAPIPSLTTGGQISASNSCVHDFGDGFAEAASTTLGKLTKEGLRNAHVIAQVDKKYILIKMRGISSNTEPEADEAAQGCDLLVVVDQHAADERIRVESLFTEICSSPADPAEPHVSDRIQKTLVFRVSKREAELMRRYDGNFAEWGIKYHLSSSSSGEESSLHIDALPRAITDRCTNEPSLAIDMIRSHVYMLSDQPAASRAHSGSAGWVTRIASCPKGLLDLLNSRACRSAIMFNDALELEECEALMRKLGRCMFPFQCAHGRPSMIPLVDLGVPREPQREGGFVQAFGKWMAQERE